MSSTDILTGDLMRLSGITPISLMDTMSTSSMYSKDAVG